MITDSPILNVIYLKTFKNEDDVWNVIDRLIKETEVLNEEKGKSFDLARSINAQLPFFTCKNHLFDKNIQKDPNKEIHAPN